jgi:transcriptional regulator with XRE-family HTH domain
MDMVRFGLGMRALRIRKRWRQKDLAEAAGVSQSVVARIERGLGGRVTPETLSKVAQPIGARIDVLLRWQGEALDRLLDRAHAVLLELMARLLRAHGWDVRTEVSFSIRGERGSVDLLAWHAESATLLIVEIKSTVPDI